MFAKIQQIANEDTKYQWGNWRALRHAYTRILDRNLKRRGRELERILMLGAGNGNDIPVDYLEAKFREIVIADIDNRALERFLAKAGDRTKYKAITMDFSGFSKKLAGSDIYKSSAEEKIKYISLLKPSADFSVIPGEFDLVINWNYTTQLAGPYFLWQSNKKNLVSNELKDAVEDLTGRIQANVFKQIAELLKPNGQVIHSTDFLELSRNMANGTTNYNWQVVSAAIDGKWDKINKIAGIEAGIVAGRMNICGSLLPEEIDNDFTREYTDYLVWHFSSTDHDEKKYVLKVDTLLYKNKA